jgi:serine protease inhibitor
MHRLTIITTLLILIFSLSCDDKEEIKLGPKEIKLTAGQVELINGSNSFGLDLFREVLAEEQASDNVFISPLSVHLALSMTWNGARGNTREQMMEVLKYPALDDKAINASIRQLIADLLSVDPKVETGIANSIWYRNNFAVEESFLNVNREYFDASVNPLDFNNPSSLNVINAWVAEKTKNRIEEIIDQIDPDHIMFLINAIYFKGIWTTEFVKENTLNRPFYLPGGGQKEVMTMETESGFAYAQRDGYKVAELPYGRGNYSMLVFLPDEAVGVDNMIEKIDIEEWERLPALLGNKHNLNLRMPRFTFEFDADLNKPLINLGMSDAFSGGMADFTGINSHGGLYISRVRHKSFVEVNEEGTEAAAVTSVEIRLVSHDPDEPQVIPFHVNRPFVIAIKEKYTNSIIFIGRVMEP